MFKSEKSLSIKTYVVFLVLGITVILAGTLGYLYSIVSRYLDDEERADKYHLSSIIFASDIKEEMQDFLIQHGNELAQKHKPGSLAGDGRPHSHTAIFDVVRQKLDEIKSLQDKFGDRRFIRILENSERHYRHVRSKVKEGVFQRDQGLNIKEIPQFIIHIDQLKRLHLVIYQTEMLDIHHRQEQDFRNFLIFLGVVSGVSFLFIFKVMLEIKKVTRRRTLTERDLFDEKERAQVTLSSIADGVITTDLGGLVDYMNPEAEKVTGFRLSQARGRAVTEIFRLQDLVPGDEERCPVSKCLNGKEILIGEREIGLLTATGSLRVIDYSVSSIFDSDTLLMGVVITFQDVTKRKVAEESARSSEQRLTL
ncbi:MAG: PAS domain S-box protein, partial [Spirochaetota bacterium]|nr:PAS domain S-box protein [Spirochaetota bacterium]